MDEPKKDRFDTIIAGLGAMGSGVAYQLARGGRRVLGLDRFRPPHVRGSSHGHTRVIRQAYGDDARYVPLVQRAYTCWHELERYSGQTLLINSGLVLMGAPQSELISTSRESMERHDIAHESLDRDEICRRWPALKTDPDMCGLWEPTGGILRVETCIEALLAAASEHGATLHFDEAVEIWKAHAESVEVRTERGTYSAANLVIAAGPWCQRLLAELSLPLWVERQVQLWFEPAANPHLFEVDRCPIFAWQPAKGEITYGFPNLGQGIKVAHHHGGAPTDPDKLKREIDDHDIRSVRQLLERLLPDANGTLNKHDVCMYTNTPDHNFLIDFHPDHPQVIIVGGFSGHGFKFAPVVGEIVRDLLADKQPDAGWDMFRLERLSRT